MEQTRNNLRRPGRFPLIILAAGSAAAGAYGVLWLRHGADAPAASATAAATPVPAPAESSRAAAIPLEKAVDAAGANALFEAVSKNSLARRWVSEANLVGRCVVVADNVAEGVSPRKPLSTFAPASPFSVERSGEHFVISPESYSRYDAMADAIASIDAQALAAAYRRLHVVLESTYRALGYPGGSLDLVTTRALRRIEDAPVVEADIQVERQGGTWVLADARLERLGNVEKHLLRMGPRNEGIVQSKAREIRQAFQLSDQVASGAR